MKKPLVGLIILILILELSQNAWGQCGWNSYEKGGDSEDSRSLNDRLRNYLTILKKPFHENYLERIELYQDIFNAVLSGLEPKEFGSTDQEIASLQHQSLVESIRYYIEWFKAESKEGSCSSIYHPNKSKSVPVYEFLFNLIGTAMLKLDDKGNTVLTWQEVGIADEGKFLKERLLKKLHEEYLENTTKKDLRSWIFFGPKTYL